MAALTAKNPEFHSGDSTPAVIADQYCAADDAAWNAGQLVRITTAGTVKQCVSDDDAGTGGINAIAVTTIADQGSDTTKVPLFMLGQDCVYRMHLTSGAASQAMVGDQYGIAVSSNVATVDTGDTSNVAVEVVGLMYNIDPYNYPIADTLAVVLVKFLPAVLNAAKAS